MEKSINELNLESKLNRIRILAETIKEGGAESFELSKRYAEQNLSGLSSYFEGRAKSHDFIADWIFEILGEDVK